MEKAVDTGFGGLNNMNRNRVIFGFNFESSENEINNKAGTIYQPYYLSDWSGASVHRSSIVSYITIYTRLLAVVMPLN